MQPKLNSLFRTAFVIVIATLMSGIMVSTAVSANPQPLFAPTELLA